MSTAYDNYIHSLLEPNEVLIMGKQKRDKELPGWMLKSGSTTSEEQRKLNDENDFKQDEYLKTHNI